MIQFAFLMGHVGQNVMMLVFKSHLNLDQLDSHVYSQQVMSK